MKSGIAVAGSILVDKINEISAYPCSGELTQIKSVKKAVGACVPNVAIDLKRVCLDLTVKARMMKTANASPKSFKQTAQKVAVLRLGKMQRASLK